MSGYPIGETLERLGLCRGSIIEAILTTYNLDGSVNAAPMGVIMEGPDHMVVRPYTSSSTYANLLRDGRACINTTCRPEMFFATAFKGLGGGLFPGLIFDGLAICSADASIFLDLSEKSGDLERPTFKGKPSSVLVSDNLPAAYSRGRSQAIEAVILASHLEYQARSGLALDSGQIAQLEACTKIVRKVSPAGSPEAIVIDAIERMASRWRVTR